MLVLEPLQLNAGFEHTNGVAARLAARAAGARSANGKRPLKIEEVIVAQSFNTKESEGNGCFYFTQRRFTTSTEAIDIAFSNCIHSPWVISNLHQNVSHSIGVGMY